jgi:hypothetical protein
MEYTPESGKPVRGQIFQWPGLEKGWHWVFLKTKPGNWGKIVTFQRTVDV